MPSRIWVFIGLNENISLLHDARSGFQMNSRERVTAALRREPVDRVPVFMWFHPDTARRLGSLLEIPPGLVGDAMGNDVHQTWVNNNYAMEGITHEQDGESHVDDWGITWTRGYGFNQIKTHPLENSSKEEMLAYQFPTAHIDEYLARMQTLAGSSIDYFLGCDISPCAFEMYWRLRGMQPAMMDMVDDPEMARTMLNRCMDFAIQLGEAACERFPLDWLWTGDDVASQSGMMFSPHRWRDLIKAGLQRVFLVGKTRGLWVAYHCCGGLRPIIPDLIEIGLDVLNPIQGNCPGMEPISLKKEFGDKLAFMGGVDTQRLLPYGSEKEVRHATSELIQGMTAGGGGFILAASHTIPPETPDENIFAMYAEAGISRAEIFDHAAQIREKTKGLDGVASAP
jgi:uroporphyrinogen decarboxylase